MKISCFSFIRDGVRLGYPFEESIRSALPLCDEFVIAVGECEDGTLQRLQAMREPKLRILETRWNENVRAHGFVYGHQKMIAQYNCTGDWAFYLEGDEILHEDDLGRIRDAMVRNLDDPRVEALAFDYYHFWGDPQHLRTTSKMYRKAARIIRNSLRTIAPDGLYWAVIKEKTWMGKRNKRRTRYPLAANTGVHIYHYGDVRAERYLAEKATTVNKYWGKEIWHSTYGDIDPLALGRFKGNHPRVIGEWLEHHANHSFELNPEYELSSSDRKHRLLSRLESRFGWDFSKRHFKIVR
ncbi:MAG: glycosyltransferase family 2 protein [Gammaproteobacteria bacterium]